MNWSSWKRAASIIASGSGGRRMLRRSGPATTVSSTSSTGWLVERRVGRHRRQEREVRPALPSQHGTPELVVLLAEDVFALRGHDDPPVGCELGVELPRAPACVPREDARATGRLGRELDLGVPADEADVLEDGRRRVLRILELRDDEHRVLVDWPADEHRRV